MEYLIGALGTFFAGALLFGMYKLGQHTPAGKVGALTEVQTKREEAQLEHFNSLMDYNVDIAYRTGGGFDE